MAWILAVAVSALLVSACAARGAAPVLPGPQPFPSVSSPASLAPVIARPPEPIAVRELLRTALDLQGTPYVWGGADPATGFDCSGFVQYVLGEHHLSAPRTAAEQFHLGTRVDLKHIRAGDLVFFSTVAPGASHVGLAISSEEFVHAPASTGVVRTERVRSTYWQSRFVGARRIL